MFMVTNMASGTADYAPSSSNLTNFDIDKPDDWADENGIVGISLDDSLYVLGAADTLGRTLEMDRQRAGNLDGPSRPWANTLPAITNPGPIGPAYLASAAFSSVPTAQGSTISPAMPEDGDGRALAVDQSQVEVEETYTGNMTISGGLNASNGSESASATFSGTIGVVIIADINSSGTGEGQELANGFINIHYSTPSGTSNSTKQFDFDTPEFAVTNGTFSYSYTGKTQFFGADFSVILKGSSNSNFTQISESMNVPVNGSYEGVSFSGAIKGAATLTAPPLTINGAGSSYTLDTSSVRPFTNVIIGDFNAGQTVSVTVTMSSPANGALSNLGGGTFNAGTGIYTVKGSVQAVTAALEALEFDPTPYQGPTGEIITTTFTISASDGAGGSATNSSTSVSTKETTPPPVLSGGGNSVNYQPGGSAVAVDPNVTVSDAGSLMLDGASIYIGQGFQSGDTLNFTNQNNIVGTYTAATGELVLSGFDTLANYQAALRSITFSSTSSEPSAAGTDLQRSISLGVTDGTQWSSFVQSKVGIGIPVTITSGETQVVSSGMTEYRTILLDGGMQLVESGGQAFGTTISSGGEIVFDGGTVGGLSFEAGALEGLAPGFQTSGLSVAFGIQLFVSSGAVASDTNVVALGIENVLAGGTVIGNSITGSGMISLSSDATASASDIGNEGTEKVASGGTDSASVVASGGLLELLGGTAESPLIEAGGREAQILGLTSDARLSGGNLTVGGGVATGTQVFAGGLALAGNFLNGPTGGTLEDTQVGSGGIMVLAVHGEADQTVIDAGATLLQLAGLASAVSLSGTQYVGGGLPGVPALKPPVPAVASGTTIASGGLQIVNPHGSAFGTVILNGGEAKATSGGTVAGAVVSSGGTMLQIQAEVSMVTVFGGGHEGQFGGTTSGVTLLGGNDTVVGGTATVITVDSGGIALAANFLGSPTGGTLDDVNISSGGIAATGVDGLISGMTAGSGATVLELAGAVDNLVLAGGTQLVGGSLPGLAEANPAPLATASGTTVSSGGKQILNGNGSAIDTSVLSGGEIVFNGGQESGLSLASGAMIDVPSLVYASSITVSFAENSSSTGGTLTVSWSSGSHSVGLLGQYVAAGFHISSDGAGGTQLTYTPATSSVDIAGAGHS